MADSQQPQSAGPNNAVSNSVVNDLMRVYENLTQSSTPQVTGQDASKALSLAYAGAPQTAALYQQPPSGYPTQYQQQPPEIAAKNSLHTKSEPPSIPPPYNYQQPQAPVYHPPIPMVAASAVPDVNNAHKEAPTILRTSSSTSQISGHQPPADASSESDSGGKSRRKRKTAAEGKKTRGKKSKKEDGRWSKRFTWPEDLHRDFVSAIFDVGLKHSSPSTIMEHMPKHDQINTERIKSHLQKYRLHRVKSKKEFISSYEASLRNFQQNQNGNTNLVSGAGEVAAHLTASVTGNVKNSDNPAGGAVSGADSNQKQAQPQSSSDGNESLMLPQLTEAEKASPIGSAMGYLMGLFFSLKQQLMIQRSLEAAGEKAKGNGMFPPAAIAPSAGNAIAVSNPSSAATAAAVAAGVEFVSESNLQQSQPQTGVRSNIEVNSMMKREMKNQMALQNKMRALKQQELDKYTNMGHDGQMPVAMEGNEAFASGVSEQPTQQQPDVATQGAGEMAGNDMTSGTREGSNLLGIEDSEEFWQTDVMEEALFDFLMS